MDDDKWLYIMKNCMKRISRKQAVLKITELGKRNMEPVVPFSMIVNIEE